MIRPGSDLTVYLCREPVDMRKQIDGLALLVQEAMDLNPFDQALFVFGNRQRDKVKLLFWAHLRSVALFLIEPGKPNQNAYIESFNGRFRDECLNKHWFTSR